MANTIHSHPQGPEECPNCAQREGRVHKAGTVLGQPTTIRLSVACHACQHEWVIDTVGQPQATDGATYR